MQSFMYFYYFPSKIPYVCKVAVTLPGQDKNESTTFHGALWVLSAQSALRKAVDFGHILLNVLSNYHSNIFKKCQN